MQNQYSADYIGKVMRRKKTASLAAMAAFGLAFGAAGCGGGGGGGTPSESQTSRASLTIQWPARSRATAAPSSALSAVVRIRGAGVSTGDVVFTINRDSTRVGGYTEQYTAPTDARTGEFTVTITFYSQADGAGDVVGTVDKAVTLTSGANSLGDVTVEGRVLSVKLAARQTIPTGAASDLVFTAFDSNGAAIAALTPGSAFFTITGGQQFLSLDNGQLKAGNTPGVATVYVTVDGKASEPQQVGIGSAVSTFAVSGARGTVPLVSTVSDFSGGITTSRGMAGSNPSLSITSNWFYANTIITPGGYGDRKFDHWASGGDSVSIDPSYLYVPANVPAPAVAFVDPLLLTAIYTPRPYPSDGFTPNFSRPEYLHWAQFPLRVAFADPALAGRLKAGIDKWVAATGGVIAYEVVSDPALADVVFTLGVPANGAKGLTTLEFDPDTREILHADIVLLQSAPQETYPTGIDLLALYATHEFGHALGVTASAAAGSGHSTEPSDTMFPTANPSAPFITERDINTVENLYPALFNGGESAGRSTRSAGKPSRSGKTATLTVRCP